MYGSQEGSGMTRGTQTQKAIFPPRTHVSIYLSLTVTLQ